MSKIAQEAVARTCARAFDLPVMIARMNASYGPNGGLPALHVDAVAAGQRSPPAGTRACTARSTRTTSTTRPRRSLDAASVPATIVNWAGDEPVSVQEWGAELGRLAGREVTVTATPVEGTLRGSIADDDAPALDHRAVPGALAGGAARHVGRAARRRGRLTARPAARPGSLPPGHSCGARRPAAK